MRPVAQVHPLRPGPTMALPCPQSAGRKNDWPANQRRTGSTRQGGSVRCPREWSELETIQICCFGISGSPLWEFFRESLPLTLYLSPLLSGTPLLHLSWTSVARIMREATDTTCPPGHPGAGLSLSRSARAHLHGLFRETHARAEVARSPSKTCTLALTWHGSLS